MGCGVVEGLVKSLGVVVNDECGDVLFGISDGGAGVEPDAFFLEGGDEAFAESVLFRGVGDDVFLGESKVAGESDVLARAKAQTVVETQLEPRDVEPIGMELLMNRFHEIPSSKSPPCKRRIFLKRPRAASARRPWPRAFDVRPRGVRRDPGGGCASLLFLG